MKRIAFTLFLALAGLQAFSQDSLLLKEAGKHAYPFRFEASGGFKGSGWDSISAAAGKSQYTMVGEIHGINEIPLLLDGLAKQVAYQAFVAEIDPFLAEIITAKIKQLPADKLNAWQRQNGAYLSFYSYQNDFRLLKTFQEKGMNLIGIDQITALNDIPVYQHLAERAGHKKNRQLYADMAKTAEEMLLAYSKDPKSVPYLMSPKFQEDVAQAKKQKLSEEEKRILEQLEYSRQIYMAKAGHQKRIKLMKNQLLHRYANGLENKKALFRLGANHSPKGESLLTIYDVGNLAHNLAESQFNSSYHVAVFAKSGEAGNAFKGKPNAPVSLPKELAFLKNAGTPGQWNYFDFKPLRKQLEAGKLDVKSEFVKRMIKGYDGLVLIPEATPATFAE